ncbi:MAG TPA: carboxypeptidase-like regulatory domain-containing protein [Terriglobales bacterium]
MRTGCFARYQVFLLAIAAGAVLSSRSSAQNSYQVVQVTDGGTITGSVKWSGARPHPLTAPITKDPQICDPDSAKSRDLERMIISANGGVANTVVYLKNVSSGKAFDFPAARQTLDQKHCRYEPHVLLVPQNAELPMKSSDSTLHLVHMDGAASYNLPFPFPNQTLSRPMNNAGVINLRCNGGHTWMNGVAFVAPHPYYAVTDANGEFKLTDVPPGQYEIVAWHEGWNVERHEDAFDVLTEKHVSREVFSDPKSWTKSVSVLPSGNASVNFVISDK